MRNIIIVGNGFDLAHNLATSYSSFIENLILTELKKKKSDILWPNISRPIGEIANKASRGRRVKFTTSDKKLLDFKTNNNFLADLILRKDENKKDWSNIEGFYYETLKKLEKADVRKLQDDFLIIKQRLIIYLNSITITHNENSNFNNFFGHLYFKNNNRNNNLILNFNYTNTLVELYKNKLNGFEVKDVHGKLTDLDSIIFGHDMSKDNYNEFIAEKEEEFFENIKFIKYRLSSIFEELTSFLEEKQPFNIYILGHSCSISDNQILRKVFESEYLNQVFILFYKESKYYQEQRRNIDFIMKGTKDIDNKIKSIDLTIQLPQYDDDEATKKIIETKLNKILVRKLLFDVR